MPVQEIMLGKPSTLSIARASVVFGIFGKLAAYKKYEMKQNSHIFVNKYGPKVCVKYNMQYKFGESEDAQYVYLNMWKSRPSAHTSSYPKIPDIVEQQEAMGQKIMFEEWMSISWEEVQQQQCYLMKTRCTGMR